MSASETTRSSGPASAPSRLASVLNSGQFALAIEISPPVGPNPGALHRQIELLRGYGDAYNVTDNQSAKVHMCSLAASILLQQAGLEPVFQLTCRDRNRLGLQSDLLGAAALGIKNVLALSGDHPVCGDHPHVDYVGDIDSMNLIRMIRLMRDEQVFESGKPIPKIAPEFLVGAAANPFSPPHDFRPQRLAKKIRAGAQFIQTQLVFNLSRFRDYMARVVDMGLHEKVPIMGGIGPIRSLKGAGFMADMIAGMDVPDYVFERFRGLSDEDQAKAGLDLCCEIGSEVMEIEGVRGLHIMAVGWPAAVPEIVRNLGLYPRPELSGAVVTPEVTEPT
ncbi:MAG: methylenetetrahydrofolate reductase [Acidobacteria bacterium]|nr:MAG: methylenetetrahydrofolate reductase [Acidobacteriota bacterium]